MQDKFSFLFLEILTNTNINKCCQIFLTFAKSKTFLFGSFQSLAKRKNFRNKKYIKLINGGGCPNKSGRIGFLFKKN